MHDFKGLAEKLVDIVFSSAGFGALILFLGLTLFVYLYMREKARNRELTDLLLTHTQNHTTRYVEVVTDGIETDNRLTVAINQLSTSISEIRAKLEVLANLSGASQRR